MRQQFQLTIGWQTTWALAFFAKLNHFHQVSGPAHIEVSLEILLVTLCINNIKNYGKNVLGYIYSFITKFLPFILLNDDINMKLNTLAGSLRLKTKAENNVFAPHKFLSSVWPCWPSKIAGKIALTCKVFVTTFLL